MTKQPDVLTLLKKDHATVRTKLEELCATTTRASKKRQTLLREIAAELRAHAKVEEEILYPAVREAAKTSEQRQLIAEAFEEHRAVEELVLPDLEATDVDTEQFGGRAKVLKDLVEHHAEEEEKEMFPQVKKLFDKDELQELGARVASRKQELLRATVEA